MKRAKADTKQLSCLL